MSQHEKGKSIGLKFVEIKESGKLKFKNGEYLLFDKNILTIDDQSAASVDMTKNAEVGQEIEVFFKSGVVIKDYIRTNNKSKGEENKFFNYNFRDEMKYHYLDEMKYYKTNGEENMYIPPIIVVSEHDIESMIKTLREIDNKIPENIDTEIILKSKVKRKDLKELIADFQRDAAGIFLPKIDHVIFNDPATIVFWEDGTKTVVHANNEAFDKEKGLAMAIAKKAYGNGYDYYGVFKKNNAVGAPKPVENKPLPPEPVKKKAEPRKKPAAKTSHKKKELVGYNAAYSFEDDL